MRQSPVLSRHAAERLCADHRTTRPRRSAARTARRVAQARSGKAVRHRSRVGQIAQQQPAQDRSTSIRSTGSITISARKPSRTFWSFASPTGCSSRSGIATTSTMSRSPSPKRWRRSSRQFLRRDRRAARHGAKPSVPVVVAGRDGATGRSMPVRCAPKRRRFLPPSRPKVPRKP